MFGCNRIVSDSCILCGRNTQLRKFNLITIRLIHFDHATESGKWDIVWLVLAGHCRCHLFSAEIVGNYIHVVKNNNDGVGCQLLFEHNFPHGERL